MRPGMRLLVLTTSSNVLLMLRVMASKVADKANRQMSAGPCNSLIVVPAAPSGRWLSDWAGRKVMRSGSGAALLSRASA